jgi:hypothetical protein
MRNASPMWIAWLLVMRCQFERERAKTSLQSRGYNRPLQDGGALRFLY